MMGRNLCLSGLVMFVLSKDESMMDFESAGCGRGYLLRKKKAGVQTLWWEYLEE
jgi:hypothetical protein